MSAIEPHPELTFLEVGDERNRRRIAVRRRFASAAGKNRPGLVWLGGFKSDMESTKAQRLDDWAAQNGRAMLRFDYSGHGVSGGRFEEGTIGLWLEESLAVIRAQTQGPQILIGSSMGGWISMLIAKAMGEAGDTSALAGMVLIAPALDFTQALIWDNLPADVKDEIIRTGRWLRPTPYSPEPMAITYALIEEGRQHLLFGAPLRSYCPVHILQGTEDPDVPPNHAMKLVHHLASDPVSLTLIKGGDHRLSREEDIARLLSAVEKIA